jgi:monoamine oxidase
MDSRLPDHSLADRAVLNFGPAIRQPVHRIHWAGAETPGYWVGYMDGAVRSGERVPDEILRAK